jgi:glutathione peroxidase-family protein
MAPKKKAKKAKKSTRTQYHHTIVGFGDPHAHDAVPLAQDIDGKNFNLSSLKNKTVLVVNLASACGFTPQYAELQDLYNKYGKQGFVVLGFPCNQFGAQVGLGAKE